MSQKEFRLANEYATNRSGPARWILSHLRRYPHLPLLVIGTAVINNFAYSYIQVLIGQGFDVISQPDWEVAALVRVAGWMLAAAATGFDRIFFSSSAIIRNRPSIALCVT